MSKYWFDKKHPESCYPIKRHREEMLENNEPERTLIGAKAIIGEGIYYCTKYGEPGDSGDGMCGKICDGYNPRNGKNGRCLHSGYCYEPTKETKTIKINIE